MNDQNFHHLFNFFERDVLTSIGEQDRFLILENLLKKTPDNYVFLAICELFINWPECQEKDKALGYAETKLSLWDDTLRHVSSSWNPLYRNGIVSTWGRLIRSIEIYRRCEEGTKELIRIAKSPSLENLQRLRIFRCEIGSEGFMALANSPYMQNLKYLEIYKTDILDEELILIFLTPYLTNLTHLQLSHLGLNDENIAIVAQSDLVKSLTHLDLSYNYIKAEGIRSLTQSLKLLNLKYLNLKHNFIRDLGVYELMQKC